MVPSAGLSVAAPCLLVLLSGATCGVWAIRTETKQNADSQNMDLELKQTMNPSSVWSDAMTLYGKYAKYRGSILSMYNIMDKSRGMVSQIEQIKHLKDADKQALFANRAENLMPILDTMREIHDVLVATLQLKPASWEAQCPEPCNDQVLDDMYTMEMTFTAAQVGNMATGLNIWIQEDGGCEMRLKKVVAKMRDSIATLSDECDKMLEKLSTTVVAKNSEPFRHYEDRGCDGDCDGCEEVPEEISNGLKRAVANLTENWKVNDEEQSPFCREVVGVKTEHVVEQCETQCKGMDECVGFTFLNGTLVDYEEPRVNNGTAVDWIVNRILGEEKISDHDVVQVYEEGKLIDPKALKACKCHEGAECNFHVFEDTNCTGGTVAVRCGSTSFQAFEAPRGICHPLSDLVLLRKATRVQFANNRCCFRLSTQNQYHQENTDCYVKPVLGLKHMNASDIVKWIENLPGDAGEFDKAKASAVRNLIKKPYNGRALSAMGRVMMKKHLLASEPGSSEKTGSEPYAVVKIADKEVKSWIKSWSTTSGQAAESLFCMVAAAKHSPATTTKQQLQETQKKCLDIKFLEKYDKAKNFVDPYVWWVMKYKPDSPKWSMKAGKKFVGWSKSFITQYPWVTSRVGQLLGLGVQIATDKVNYESVAAMYKTGNVNYLSLSAASTALLHSLIDRSLGQCLVIERLVAGTEMTGFWQERADAELSAALD